MTTHFTVVSIVSSQYYGNSAYTLESAIEMAKTIRERGFADRVFILTQDRQTELSIDDAELIHALKG